MSLETRALEMAIAIGEDVKMLKESIGNPNDLITNSKTIDGAIAELQQELNTLNTNSIISD